ncbi:MAG: DUF4126 domain-containing protein [Candidatus Sabulitectum sp.]|nr:DUF4126 domain-containing protein [Candidatus Sabulitectum sp.]
MEWVLGVLVGVSLSAACGFRVFVPMLVMSIAVHSGHLEPASGFEWLGSLPALMGFGLATALEIVAYFVPVVNNALDVIATPAAAVAGTILTASMAGELSPVFRWVLAVVAGGAVAGGVQLATVSLRSAVTPLGGTGLISAAEDGAAVATSILAVTIPLLAVSLIVVFGVFLMRRKHLREKRV